jgi:hypothetical protein
MVDSLAESRLRSSNVRALDSSALPLPLLEEWLSQHAEHFGEHWYREVVRRSSVPDPAMRALLREFLGFMASLVPGSISGERKAILDVWRRASELYGSLGSLRGLAAGEVVEEMQIFREAILRTVFMEPPSLIGAELKLREALRINRFVDVGVTQASVSHTDDLFFQLLEGNGVPGTPTPDLLKEIRDQLASLMTEAAEFLHGP